VIVEEFLENRCKKSVVDKITDNRWKSKYNLKHRKEYSPTIVIIEAFKRFFEYYSENYIKFWKFLNTNR